MISALVYDPVAPTLGMSIFNVPYVVIGPPVAVRVPPELDKLTLVTVPLPAKAPDIHLFELESHFIPDPSGVGFVRLTSERSVIVAGIDGLPLRSE